MTTTISPGYPRPTKAFAELRGAAEDLARQISNGPIVPAVAPEEIRRHLKTQYDFTTPVPLDDLIADVEGMLRKWQVHVTHPRYLGLFNPSVTTASVVGESLAALYNPQLATWRTSPAANEIERHTLAWLAGKFGLPDGSAANFTSGGAESNFSAVSVALARHFPRVREEGVRALPRSPAIYLTRGAHHGFWKTARMAGLGTRALRTVAMDSEFRMDVSDLARQIDADRRSGLAPFLVIATAGMTATGAIDPLPEIASYCRSQEVWFHVDAAWAGAAALSPRLSGHLNGISDADSITCDAHKWFSVPMGAGMFFCRHAEAVTQAFESDISFMPHKTGDTIDPYSATMQWSRRFIGLKLFLSLAERGESGYAEMVEHQARLGDLLRERLRQTGWRIVNNTPLPLVCFTRPGLVASRFLAELYRRQIAWMSEVQLDDGDPVLRACITSFRTTDRDIETIVEEMNVIA